MFEGMSPPQKEALCPMMSAATKLDAADIVILTEALADVRWSAPALAEALTERGFKTIPNQIAKHRQEKCSCAK